MKNKNSAACERMVTIGKHWLLRHKKSNPSAETRITNAFSSYELARSFDPHNGKLATAYYQLGLMLQARKELDFALISYEQASTINPNHFHALLGTYQLYLKKKEAANKITRATTMQTKAMHALGRALSVYEISKPLELDPQVIIGYWSILAKHQTKNREDESAKNAYLAITKHLKTQDLSTTIDKHSFDIYIGSAIAMLNAKETAIAQFFLRHAARYPQSKESHIAYLFRLCAEQHMDRQNELKALKCYKFATRYATNDMLAQYCGLFGEALKKIGLLSMAETKLSRAINLNHETSNFFQKTLYQLTTTCSEPWAPYLEVAIAKTISTDKESINVDAIKKMYESNGMDSTPSTQKITTFLLKQSFGYLINDIHPKLIPMILHDTTKKSQNPSTTIEKQNSHLENVLTFLSHQSTTELLKNNCTYLMMFALKSMRNKQLSDPLFLKKAIHYFTRYTRQLASTKKESDFTSISHIIEKTHRHIRTPSYAQIMATRYGEIVNHLITNKQYKMARVYCQKMLSLGPKNICYSLDKIALSHAIKLYATKKKLAKETTLILATILITNLPKNTSSKQKKSLLAIYNDCLQYCIGNNKIAAAIALCHQALFIEPNSLACQINDAYLLFIGKNGRHKKDQALKHRKLSVKFNVIFSNPALKKITREQQTRLLYLYDRQIQYYCNKAEFNSAISLCEQAIQINTKASNYYTLRIHEIACQSQSISSRNGRTCSRIFEKQNPQERPKPDKTAFDNTQETLAYFDQPASRQALSPVKNTISPKKTPQKGKINNGEENAGLTARKLF